MKLYVKKVKERKQGWMVKDYKLHDQYRVYPNTTGRSLEYPVLCASLFERKTGIKLKDGEIATITIEKMKTK